MHHRFLLQLLLGVLFASVSLRAQAPATAPGAAASWRPGRITVAKVTGKAWMSVADKPDRIDVIQDMSVPQSAKITTGNDGVVVLVFANGAQTHLSTDTELVIDKFLLDPFDEQGKLYDKETKVADLTDEPTGSETKLTLNRGELVGNVKKLSRTKNSKFDVQTPVGAAGIRGTTFRLVFRPSGNGQAYSFQLTTTEGKVEFNQGSSGGSTTANVTGTGTTTVPVSGGQEIIIVDVVVTVNAQGQTVVTVVPPAPAEASSATPAKIQAVTEVAVAVATVAAQTIFPPSTGGTGASPPATTTTTTSTTTTSTDGTKTTESQTASTGNGVTTQLNTTTVTTPPPRITSTPNP